MLTQKAKGIPVFPIRGSIKEKCKVRILIEIHNADGITVKQLITRLHKTVERKEETISEKTLYRYINEMAKADLLKKRREDREYKLYSCPKTFNYFIEKGVVTPLVCPYCGDHICGFESEKNVRGALRIFPEDQLPLWFELFEKYYRRASTKIKRELFFELLKIIKFLASRSQKTAELVNSLLSGALGVAYPKVYPEEFKLALKHYQKSAEKRFRYYPKKALRRIRETEERWIQEHPEDTYATRTAKIDLEIIDDILASNSKKTKKPTLEMTVNRQ